MQKFKVRSCEVQASIHETSAVIRPSARMPPQELTDKHLIVKIAQECDVLKACSELCKQGEFDAADILAAAKTVRPKLNKLLDKHMKPRAAGPVIIMEEFPVYRSKPPFHETYGWMMRGVGDGNNPPVEYKLVAGQLKGLLFGCIKIVIEPVGRAAKRPRTASKAPARRRTPRKER